MKNTIIAFLVVFLGPFTVYNDGAIISDFKLRREFLVPADVSTTDRKCTTYTFLFHDCSFKYTLNGKKFKKSYFMLAFSSPDTVYLLKGATSGRITSTVGQDYFWNRIFLMIAMCSISLLMLPLALAGMFGSKGRRKNGQSRSHVPPGMRGTVRQDARVQPGMDDTNLSVNGGFGKRRSL